jgi:hypothetical protein
MPSKQSSDVKFKIGHVLFIDIVGYSKLLITEQSEQIQKLREIVRGTEQFRVAKSEGKLLGLPTGDGGALVFRNSPEAPVLCAFEISKELKSHPELRVRMGVHSVRSMRSLILTNKPTLLVLESMSRSGSWIAGMKVTFCSHGMSRKTWNTIRDGVRICTTLANAR